MNQQILMRVVQKRMNPDGGGGQMKRELPHMKPHRYKKFRKPGFKDGQNLGYPNNAGGNRHL